MEYERKYDCCQLCGIDADVEPVDQETGLCAACAGCEIRQQCEQADF